ncbi:MAG: SPFH domain-containing protein [Firmicutes bacterium]|nr:SPFH domain-containing protein [Bacillota bacterium]
MGFLLAAMGGATSVLMDQWKEYFICDSIPDDILVVKGRKKRSGLSSNVNDNIITNGSGIVVADGQCVLITQQGKVVDYCAEPGRYTYDISTEPSLFDGGVLSENVRNVFDNMVKRFTYGGDAPQDQRVYYFNTKEIVGNKYGTPSPVPFRVVDERAGIDIDISLACFGEYSFKITNPLLFYTNVCGNVANYYSKDELQNQMRTELLTALQPAFARLSQKGVRYSEVPAHTMELAEALNDELSSKWRDLRGIEIISFGISSLKAKAEDEAMIKEMQRNVAFKDPTTAASYLVGAQGAAMQEAAKNQNGAAAAFMGMNMAQGAGGVNAQGLYQMGAQQPAKAETAAPAAEGWTCPSCGTVSSGNFCPECGAPRPARQCRCKNCGFAVEGALPKFCPNCGAPFEAEA